MIVRWQTDVSDGKKKNSLKFLASELISNRYLCVLLFLPGLDELYGAEDGESQHDTIDERVAQ